MSSPDIYKELPTFEGLIWVPFQLGHAAVMNIQAQNFQHLSRAVPIMDMLAFQAAKGHAITAILHGRPVGCCGAVTLWPGVEELWMITEERGRKFALTMTKAALVYRDFRVKAGNLHRLQIVVRCDDERAVKWGKAIGFHIEGRMEKYGPDKADFFIMARS
jgi:RimJ/RimL family protein N-acetyltransferase